MKLKQQAFAEVARVTRPECVLASNTSTLDVDQFARASGRPGQVVGHHFFSPANVMKLVEVVRGKQTSPSVLATSVRLARRLGKIPVVVGNCFGFVANRMLAYYLREAHLLLEEGASVEQIDGIMTAFGMPVGPFGMQDIAGIDVGARIRQYVASLGRPHAEGRNRKFQIACSRWGGSARRPRRAGIDTSRAAGAESPTRSSTNLPSGPLRSAASRVVRLATMKCWDGSPRHWPTRG
jgi:3-hydroxyacyl-CoA dehydrogenase